MSDRTFLRVAGIAAALTALTTLVVHFVPNLWSDVDTFDEQVALRLNPIYMARLWTVLLHCVLVVISMTGAALVIARRARFAAWFGLGSYVLFAVMELLRTSLVIFAVNRAWRAAYATSHDYRSRELLRGHIEQFLGIGNALFFLFLAAFTAGLLCYGFGLLGAEGLDGKMAWLFLAWGALNLPGLADTITGTTSFGASFGWVGEYFQPVARAIIAGWLLARAKSV